VFALSVTVETFLLYLGDLCVLCGETLDWLWRFSTIPSPPTPLCDNFVTNKALMPNRPLSLPCVTLGRPLHGPWVAQGWPNPNPKPNRQRVADFPKYQIPLTKYPFLSKIILPPPGQWTPKKYFVSKSTLYRILFGFVKTNLHRHGQWDVVRIPAGL
jgi:hypothetical protein